MRIAHRVVLNCGALVLMASLAACSGGGRRNDSPPAARVSPADSGAGVSGGQEVRSERGNPPFYNVLGKRYHVLPTSAGYRMRGVASWYGPDFHGLATSSGEQYDMNAMTAAHTTLPLPTWVEVTNLENGRTVIVKVNDRGPFVDNRLIDLSYAAALRLDMVRNGTARVEVRSVAAPYGAPIVAATAPPPAAPAAPVVVQRAASPSDSRPVIVPTAADAPAPIAASVLGLPTLPLPHAESHMFVQAGAFAERGNAERLVARLHAGGFANPVIVSDRDGRRSLHRVRVPIRDSDEFDRVKSRLLAAGVTNPQLVVDR
jgi:rare lipoprotein A